MWSTDSLMKPGLMAFTTAYAPLTANPVRPPFESTSSLMTCTQSATTFGRLPGTRRMSVRVAMARNLPPLSFCRRRAAAVVRIAGMARQPSPRAALSILTGLNFRNYLDRFIPAAILPTILATFGLSDAKGGFLQTLFILTFVVVSPLAGWLGDR